MNYREQALAELTGPGGPFEVVEGDVQGERVAMFKRRQPNLRAVWPRRPSTATPGT